MANFLEIRWRSGTFGEWKPRIVARSAILWVDPYEEFAEQDARHGKNEDVCLMHLQTGEAIGVSGHWRQWVEWLDAEARYEHDLPDDEEASPPSGGGVGQAIPTEGSPLPRTPAP